ncbi:DarT ssDNA thymidine ADP-ribosyltransferase family protein [Hyphococcus flavus]|uniref:DarT ssDNA thymidine ADP-ribosyltransferase family protein n=1 Tax=Hyphococcus flavus TaxID=1866326 RepID=A0AAE9ZE93_9PROT|nr:DarT ssDNA thymidine ADP-ribosyltransferase family protein [Hyphococcus flavus]WDI31113.1 DarT ssDNA thymidine ADP-ribosyltransferase family protein [Hyphococcus flavus]
MPIREDIKIAAEQIGITYLVHFTRAENLDSIARNGLLPRSRLLSHRDKPTFNDQYRLDKQCGAICCSLQFPNYKMFYKCRENHKDTQWIVLGIKARILWTKDCAFCVENAASNNVRHLPIDERKTAAALNALYNERDGGPTREKMGIKKVWPTNPQAEVLVFDTIETSEIFAVACNEKKLVDQLTPRFPMFKIQKISDLFWPRLDYSHW